jgi:hypothetical protein
VKTEEGSGCIEWINRYRSESNVFTPETVLSSQRVPFAQRDHATGLVIGWRQHAIFNQSADIAILTYHKFPGQP